MWLRALELADEAERLQRQFVRYVGPGADAAPVPDDVIRLAGRSFDQIEREVFSWALRRHGGSRRRAARALSVARSTFCDKVRRYCL